MGNREPTPPQWQGHQSRPAPAQEHWDAPGGGAPYPQEQPRRPQQQYDPAYHQQRIGGGQPDHGQHQPYPGQPQYGQPGWDKPPQQPYPPQPGRPSPGRKSWPTRHKALTGIIAAAAIVIVAVAATATASSKPSAPAANTAAGGIASPSASPPSASAPARPGCAAQLKTWVDGGQLITFSSDIGSFSTAIQTLAGNMQSTGAAPAGDAAAVQSDAAVIESDAQAVEARPAPTCIPGLRANVADAAKDYSTTAIDMTDALNQLSAGNTAVATADVDSASAAEGKGNAKISAASGEVTAYTGSHGG